jgi:hypothetical protein
VAFLSRKAVAAQKLAAKENRMTEREEIDRAMSLPSRAPRSLTRREGFLSPQ